MANWLPAALLSLFSFGLWGLFTKVAVTYIDSKSALLYQAIGVLMVGLIMVTLFRFKPATDLKGLTFSLLTGLVYGIGCLFYFIAADKGKLATVITLTALYPFVTIVLAYILLKEAITSMQCVGILCALLSILCMSV